MQSTLKNSKNIISKILSNGGIAILPTDTIYSLSCITSNTNSLKQILKIKGRDAAQGIPVLVPSIDYFNVYAQNINNNIEKIIILLNFFNITSKLKYSIFQICFMRVHSF